MPVDVPDGWGSVALDSVDSTNAEALRRARQGEMGPLWVWAKTQRSGRGRHGKVWSSQPGNLYCTALLPGGRDPRLWTQLSFVAGLAVYDAAASCLNDAQDHHLAVKWPNDLLLNGEKASGILIESTVVAQSGTALAIGIGLNVRHSPPGEGLPYGATHLARFNDTADVESAFKALMQGFSRWHDIWSQGRGFGVVRDTWMARAHGLGQRVNVNKPDGQLTGQFETLDDDGAMVLQLDDGTQQRILVGDLFLAAERATAGGVGQG